MTPHTSPSTRGAPRQSAHILRAGRRGGRAARVALELRIARPSTVLPAVALPLLGAALMLLLVGMGRPARVVDSAAGLVLEGICPLGAAVAAVSLVGRDPGLELSLATPTRYHSVLSVRVGLTAAMGALCSLLLGIALFAAGAWPAHESPAGVVLAWGAPLVWLGGLGLFAAVATGSAAAGSGLIGALWLAEILGTDSIVSDRVLRTQYLYSTHIQLHGSAWIVNRAALLMIGTAALMGAGVLLRRPERLLYGGAA